MPLEPQAQALYDVLEAIFDYADVNLEPREIGLFTTEKTKVMLQRANMMDELAVYSAIPASVLAAQYKAIEIPIYILPPYVLSDSPYQYRDADQPALTKAGWIKAETLGLFTDLETGTDVTYRFIQGCIANCDLQIKNPADRSRFPGGRYVPLPEKSTVEWYARSLAPEVGIHQVEGLTQRMQAAAQPPKSSGMTQEQFNLARSRLMEQERQNQLSAMRANMANATMRRAAESIDMMSGIGGGPVRYSWETL